MLTIPLHVYWTCLKETDSRTKKTKEKKEDKLSTRINTRYSHGFCQSVSLSLSLPLFFSLEEKKSTVFISRRRWRRQRRRRTRRRRRNDQTVHWTHAYIVLWFFLLSFLSLDFYRNEQTMKHEWAKENDIEYDETRRMTLRLWMMNTSNKTLNSISLIRLSDLFLSEWKNTSSLSHVNEYICILHSKQVKRRRTPRRWRKSYKSISLSIVERRL